MSMRNRTAAVLIALLAGTGPTAAAPDVSSPQQARAVLLSYFDALQRGDAATAGALLGCDLKTKRLPLLNNRQYAARFLDGYRDASFALGEPRPVPPDGVAFRATITSPEQAPSRREFLLRPVSQAGGQRDYRVCAEGEPDAAGF